MQYKKELRETYNQISRHFGLTRQAIWKEVGMLFEKTKENSKILDFAAGTGRHALYAKTIGHDVVCLDFSKKQLLEIRKKDTDMPLVMSDLTETPLKERSFDAVLYIAAIHHLKSEEERVKSLLEAKRVLRPEGLILVSAWSVDAPKFRKENTKSQDMVVMWDKKHPRYYHLFVENELESLVKKAGLEVICSKKTDDNFWVLAKA